MTDTPRVRSEFVASWNLWTGAVCVALEDYKKIESELAFCETDRNRAVKTAMQLGRDLDKAADALAALFTECVRMHRLYELRPQHLAEQETQNIIDAARREHGQG